ncbi:outer membrane beta-barrel protein [Bradyrhizobium sp. CSA207]|uniref:outer membrane protein n=1 Tax=Bradyrhizobium sp. CSA207 TaxID=2698826 RepID=UPI0023B19B55|nr:porin family protein [Bradyrhizobium sp. CSA207]MDE5446150.1 outer membrane beta-barrel protein [Bradyrhizobium sp. CSA207]
MRRLLLAAAMLGTVSTAHAADMPDLPILRGGFTDGLSTTAVNWQGYYVGGQGDYGTITSKIASTINSDIQSTFVTPGPPYNWQPLAAAHSNSAGYGAFAGYNGQWDDVVLGLEANYIHGGFKSTSSSTGQTYNSSNVLVATTGTSAVVGVSDFGSLRVRAGYAWGCFLPYAFIGGGVGSQTVDRYASASPTSVLPATTFASKSKLVYGYSGGLGFDVMLVGGLFVRAEYEFQRVTSDIESNINTVRAGLGYKF